MITAEQIAKCRYLFFDLDGTLTDPGVGITNSVMYALEQFGIHVEDRTSLYKFIGPPLMDSFRMFYGFSEEDAWKGLSYYREYFGDRGIFENKVYEGIPELLQRCIDQGKILMVATSKPTEYAQRILERFDLARYFSYVSGSSMNENNSAKSQIIRHALEHNNIEAGEVIMIGDREHDVIGAKANGMLVAGVLYGYGSHEEHCEAGADHIVSSVDELKILLTGC